MAQLRPILAVSGGRRFGLPASSPAGARARLLVRADLAALWALPGGGPEALAHGGARGLDELAAEEAHALGYHVLPPWLPETEPDGRWKDNGAALRRNVRMLVEARPRALVAYPDVLSTGTYHCAANAARLGIPTVVTVAHARDADGAAREVLAGARHYLSASLRSRLRLAPGGDPRRVGLYVEAEVGPLHRASADSLDALAGALDDAERPDVRAAVAFLLSNLPRTTGIIGHVQ